MPAPPHGGLLCKKFPYRSFKYGGGDIDAVKEFLIKGKFVFTVILVLFLILPLAFIGCSDSNSLSGNWEEQTYSENKAELEFSGKTFTITEYPYNWFEYTDNNYRTNEPLYTEYWSKSLPFNKHFAENTTVKDVIDHGIEVGVSIGSGGYEMKKWVDTLYQNISKGTYSLSDNEIELTFSDGSVQVFSFSRTKDTITIAETRFIRK
jgi:hypothetical protein